MYVEEIRRQVEVAPRAALPAVAAALWRALADGQVTESEAEELSGLLEARRTVQSAAKPLQRHVGSRPRSSASMLRRRTWAARSLAPPQIAAQFTLAEQAVLAVVAAEVRRRQACDWTIGQIAAVSGVSETTVKRALREARRLGLVSIQERRLTAWRNAPNVVRIIAPAWIAWLRLAPIRGGGVQTVPPTKAKIQTPPEKAGTKGRGLRGEEDGKGTARRPLKRRLAEAGGLSSAVVEVGCLQTREGLVWGG